MMGRRESRIPLQPTAPRFSVSRITSATRMIPMPATAPLGIVWAARLPLALAQELDPVRRVGGWEGWVVGDTVWVRGGALSDEQQVWRSRIPWEAQYELREGNWLFEKGRSLPTQPLPPGPWRPLAEILTPVAPTAALAGELRGRVVFELLPSATEQPATLLQAPLPVWGHYALSAPMIRLAPLQFVVNEAQNVALICGTPLPPLSGRRFYQVGRIIMPLGYAPFPRMSAATLAILLELEEDETALLDEAGTYAIVKRSAWRPVDRSIVRSNTHCRP